MKKEKVFRKITMGFLSLILMGMFALVTSCSNDDEKYYDITHKVVYKAEGSAGVNITYAGYMDLRIIAAKNLSGTTWTSPEITITQRVRERESSIQGAAVGVEATGADATSTLKVQIYVDGVLKTEQTTTGQNLITMAGYDVEFKAN